MEDLLSFPITRRWPPLHPERLQYYGLPTPNGVKVSIMLEEVALPYEAHKVNLASSDQTTREFLSLNPNGKIPAILDPHGPDGRPMALFESGAILLYLADKTGKLMPADPAARWTAVQWLMFQMGGVGPMFGQVGFFVKFAGRDWEDKRPRDRYVAEARRLLKVMDDALAGKSWFLGDEFSIVDISVLGTVNNLMGFYGAKDLVRFEDLTNVPDWLARGLARPAVQRGLSTPS